MHGYEIYEYDSGRLLRHFRNSDALKQLQILFFAFNLTNFNLTTRSRRSLRRVLSSGSNSLTFFTNSAILNFPLSNETVEEYFDFLRGDNLVAQSRIVNVNNVNLVLTNYVTALVIDNFRDIERAYLNNRTFTNQDLDRVRDFIENHREYSYINLNLDTNERVIVPLQGPHSQLRAILRILRDRHLGRSVEVIGISGDSYRVQTVRILTLTFWRIDTDRSRAPVGHSEFKNVSTIDLKRYQIFRRQEEDEQIPCLLKVLQVYGVDPDKIDFVRYNMPPVGQYLSKRYLNSICIYLKHNIYLETMVFNGPNKFRFTWFPQDRFVQESDAWPTIPVCQFMNHVFLLEPTIYSFYSVDNLHDLQFLPDFHNISGRRTSGEGYRYVRATTARKLTSRELVHKLYDKKQLVPVDWSVPVYRRNKSDITLSNLYNFQREIELNKEKEHDYNIFYFDTECSCAEGKHQPILAAYSFESKSDVHVFRGENCFRHLLNHLCINITQSQKVVGYAHNLKYDLIVNAQQVYRINSVCWKDNKLYSAVIVNGNHIIELRDSYKLISFPLRDFKKMFDLSVGKQEILPYEYFKTNHFTRENNWVLRDDPELMKYFKPPYKLIDQSSEFVELLNLIYTNELRHGRESRDYICTMTHVNMNKFLESYLRDDVNTLKFGVIKFKEQLCMINHNSGIDFDVNSVLTSSSYGFKFFKHFGCLEGCFEINGPLRDYFQKAVRGGRCFVNECFEQIELVGKICDLDVTSLYPYAIYLLGILLGGIPMGKCRFFRGAPPPDATMYFATIVISKINRYCQIPVVSLKNDQENTVYYNAGDLPDQPLVISKIALEDYIKFADIEYEIKHGVYWNEGGNTKCADAMQKLADFRKELKRQGNKGEKTIKLTMNSIYGKSIQHVIEKVVAILGEAELEMYLGRNYQLVKRCTSFGKHNFVEISAYDESYNVGYFGVLILDISKRVMNEVIAVCSSLNIHVFYTDTDSIFLQLANIDRLARKFKEIYDKDLIGTELGQMHCDFDISCGHKQVAYSDRAIFLGRKLYVHHLVCPQCGNQEFFFRSKGIPEDAIIRFCEQNNFTVMDLYRNISEGESYEMDLNPPGRVRFDVKLSGIQTMENSTFIRTVGLKEIKNNDFFI